MIEFWSISCNDEHSLVSLVYHCVLRYIVLSCRCNAGRSKMKDVANFGFKFHLWKLLGNTMYIYWHVVLIEKVNSFLKSSLRYMHWSAYIYILANFRNWNKPEKSFMSIIRNQQLDLRLNIGFHAKGTFGMWEDFLKYKNS